ANAAGALVACLAALAPLAGCGGGGAASTASSASSPPAATSAAPLGAPIFDPTLLHEARLDMDPSAWPARRRNYLAQHYYSANFSVDGVSVSQVGVRSRGSGSRNEAKPGMKVDMNKYVQGQEYYGYKSVDLDNLATDASMIRERLSFLVYEAMGIQAPRNA